MSIVKNHLKRYPNARPTTISDKLRVEATTEQLRTEVEALHRANTYSTKVNRQPPSLFDRIKNIGLWPSWVGRW